MLKLRCVSQNYAWGKIGGQSLVGKIHAANIADGAEGIDDKPFAEFWMGDHTNGPSKILVDSNDQNLVSIINDQDFIQAYDGQEVAITKLFELNAKKFLGETYLDKLASKDEKLQVSLSYLFKVLSVRTALSIQAHPNKALAEKLHAERPDKYKDPNHKPEIAIAISPDFKACYGFLDKDKLKQNLEQNPVLAEQLPLSLGDSGTEPDEKYLQNAVAKMFMEIDAEDNRDTRLEIIESIKDHINGIAEDARSEHQCLFLTLLGQYGNEDIGLIFIFFLNILKP